jgi:hypothetical protein
VYQFIIKTVQKVLKFRIEVWYIPEIAELKTLIAPVFFPLP